jgi:hypothetical protein
MTDVDRILIYIAVGAAVGALFALVRYAKLAVDLLQAISERRDT